MYEVTFLHTVDPHYNYLIPLLSVCILDWVNLALLIILVVLTKSNFYVFFFLLPFIIQHAMLLIALVYQKFWKNEDFRPFGEFSLYGIAQLWSSNSDTLFVTRWLVVRNVVFCVLFTCWFRALWMYGQVQGINYGLGLSFAGKSSCSTDYLSGDNVFNPYGSFGPNNVFSWNRYYAQCVFDEVTWANPSPLSQHRVSGYSQIPASRTLDCSNPQNTGFISVMTCPLAQSYPDLTLGVATPVVYGVTTSSVEYCPGNKNNELVCYDPTNTFLIPCTLASPTISRVPGKPYKICPSCLNYIRGISNQRYQPEGYERCNDYDESEGWDWYCIWCPGQGYGWLADEVATTAGVTTGFWLATVSVMILYPFEWFVYFALCGSVFTYKKD